MTLEAEDRVSPTDLLTRGFFPDRVIPPLNSRKLEAACGDVLDFVADEVTTAKANKWKLPHRSRCSQHSVPKRKHLRRRLGIPNPRYQAILCDEVSATWPHLKKICEESPISLTSPRKSSTRAIEGSSGRQAIAAERASRSVGARYLLQTDLASFYLSIYTHIIPWAIHDKSKARADKKRELYGNRLDGWVRETQDKQTKGIAIGPDTSFLIAEVIASRIDVELQRQVKLRGTRYIDDYHLYFDTLANAEKALSGLYRVAAEYELEVNDAKTEIIELPEPLEPSWKTQLRAIGISDGNDPTSIKALFDRGFELAKQHPHDSVLTYTAKKMRGLSSLQGKSWEVCEPLLLRACFGEPSMLPVLLEIYEQHTDGDHTRLQVLIEELCLYHGRLHQGFEVAWSLWVAKKMGIKLSRQVGEIVSQIDDDIVALAALDLRDSDLLLIEDAPLWQSHLTEEDLYSEHWLLAYEAGVHDWITAPAVDNYIRSDEFFSILRRYDVSFYDSGTEVAEGNYESGYFEDEEDDVDENGPMTSPHFELVVAMSLLHLATAFHGLPHGDFVGEFDVAAYGDAHGDARHLHSQRLQQL
jgi:hypothetical protein